MNKKTALIISLTGSFPCAIVCALYTFMPLPLSTLVWCIFVGYCTTYLSGLTIKEAPKLLCNHAVGVVWALAFNYFYILMLKLGCSGFMAMFLDVFIITVALMFVHIGFLQNTWLNRVPLLFPSVFLIFACGGDMSLYPYMILSMVVGAFTALLTDPFCSLFMKKKI